MSTKKNKMRVLYYRQTCKGSNYSPRNFWCPGDVLEEDDEELLKVVKDYYQEYGYPPCRGDMPLEIVSRLKGRFRTWKNVMLAAGLPEVNSAEAQRKRKEILEKKLTE